MTPEFIKKIASLISYENSPSDPKNPESKLSLVFYLDGFTKIYGTKKNQAILPFEMSKRSVNDLFQMFKDFAFIPEIEAKNSMDHADRMKVLAAYPEVRLLDRVEKQYKGITSYLLADPINVAKEELADSFRVILGAMSQTISDLEANPSQADPDADCKRRFCKAAKYQDLLAEGVDPIKLVQDSIDREINNLLNLMEKAKNIKPEDYKLFLAKKFSDNGLDEDGFVMLRKVEKKAEATVTPTTSEAKPSEDATTSQESGENTEETQG